MELDVPRQETQLRELVRRARELAADGRRTLLGVTGAPGAGKSTLGRTLADNMDGTARVVGMDGFHLSKAQLARMGRLDRMGAIDTFDAVGFLVLLRRLRDPGPDTVFAPEFRRELEEPIAGSTAIEADVGLVIVEGNYLLASEGPWGELHSLFDEVWYCERDEATRLENLIARHRAFGKSDAEARRWALGPDQRNADLIATMRQRADLVVTIDLQALDTAPASP